MNKLYLFCYDFPSDKEGNRRRAKLAKLLEGHGNRVQYSVFEGRFKNQEDMDKLIKKIEKIVVKSQDSLRVYPLPLNVEKEILIFGEGEVFHRDDVYVF
jgi:CRISPR-associated protein Cas2